MTRVLREMPQISTKPAIHWTRIIKFSITKLPKRAISYRKVNSSQKRLNLILMNISIRLLKLIK